MNNIKSFSVIDQSSITGNIHIVGCGALGSQIAERLFRLNLTSKIIAYDFDIVEEKNLNNQTYFLQHIGLPKVEALADIAKSIDPDATLRYKNKKIKRLIHKEDDIIILALDNFNTRSKILESITGNPLVLSGGVSSYGGNIEITRGTENYQTLAEEYSKLPSGQEYDEDDLTPCGSPISIYHRIGIAAAIACEAIIKYKDSQDPLKKNIMYDLPNYLIIK